MVVSGTLELSLVARMGVNRGTNDCTGRKTLLIHDMRLICEMVHDVGDLINAFCAALRRSASSEEASRKWVG
jgi:hypothetical protein